MQYNRCVFIENDIVFDENIHVDGASVKQVWYGPYAEKHLFLKISIT